MTDNDVRKRIYEEQRNQIEQDMSPFGFIVDGLEGENVMIDDNTGDRWLVVEGATQNAYTEKWNVDEYGDRAYMWDYR
jgi:hypothetical protein